MKKLMKAIREKIKKLNEYIVVLANASSYAIHH